MDLEIWAWRPKQQNVQECRVEMARSDSEWYSFVLLVPRVLKDIEQSDKHNQY